MTTLRDRETETAFRPYIPPEKSMPELTVRALIVGTVLGMIFGASSLYLVLKVGLTVSASIPVAVISITIFSILAKFGARNATILENNIVQTAGSAGESIAFGIGVTMPAIMILGFDLEIGRVLLVSILGGLLGILMMIPLRRALIVHQHGKLKYPEGTACAAVLRAGASAESRALADDRTEKGDAAYTGGRIIFIGFGIGLAYTTIMAAFKGWKDIPEKVFGPPLKAGSVAIEVSPALLGVGYIIGPRIAAIMCAGGVLADLVLIPAIMFFAEGVPGPISPAKIPVSEMTSGDIRGSYILYIGAGAVAMGGIISLVRSLPIILHGLKQGLSDLKGDRTTSEALPRTDRDLSMKVVVVGIVALLILIMAFPALRMNLLGAILIIAFGFLFVTVSSRLTGEIGSSSNPISGMTVATLLLTCLFFLILGWTSPPYYVTALSVGAIVCIAASNGGTTSQDLKTGFLVGATPKLQQIAILIGALVSALVLGPILLKLNDSATVYVPQTPSDLRVDVSKLTERGRIRGPQAREDQREYFVWHNTDEKIGPAGQYLVNEQGEPVYLVDPGINGTHTVRPDGTEVEKFRAPKATLMSYIIKGILNQQLPWALVLLGVMIAIVLEMSGIPSLAFAVGVYLPLASSAPIFVGGMTRWLVDRKLRSRLKDRNLTEEELVAEADKSPGVLMASGYIAGGAIAGIIIAIVAGAMPELNDRITKASEAANPFFAGDHADLLSLLPFAILTTLLYLVGREMFLTRRKSAADL
jgi:putative OPT family oligopeptide transporter